ncbi:MAG: hypothetical protein COV59_01450 [Candidatus Magasanikbacteria bacterium CG11_big_fil_rev_8_21_14_0_20_39_34]|uniref:Uncharacterized protein n=1 Tax=Candidatus Magasanikbacteria bacterium CG11_big_fil_rev_8_21_14_0_20_39_34 TaxID=1974653 RepID=A0A2H0N5W4_9BACT|nr:MAG: hypothetical protein COV59_01450 [Candidatus Magasanikbacteria bacterium CG11_big_fil_rev_8_21_14_0_20_39_34]
MPHSFDIDNMYCGAIRRGDVFLCSHKKDEEQVVVVLQDNVLNEGLSTVVCAVVEPVDEESHVFANEVLLEEDEGGVGEKGICKLYKILTVDRRAMIAKKGELSTETLMKIYKAQDINCGRFRDTMMDLE